jgi:large subunit ribosomal protein L9
MTTEVILLERVENLGQMGDVVRVKPGFARNYLLPQKKALRATKNNLAFFETQRKAYEASNLKKKQEAEKIAEKLNGQKIILVRQASEAGQLFGSVTTRDIADGCAQAGFAVNRAQVQLNQALKTIGLIPVAILLHPEVKVQVTLNIARSEEEAKLQEKTGKALIIDPNQRDEKPARAAAKDQAVGASDEAVVEAAVAPAA